jgi:tetratricopeptide (TPR) repeat protein
VERAPGQAWSQVALGESYGNSGAYALEELHCYCAHLLKPDEPLYMNDVAYAWACQGKNLDGALRLASEANRRRPGGAYWLDTLAWVHYRRGEFDQARSTIDQRPQIIPRRETRTLTRH